jgi:hypothetical protein
MGKGENTAKQLAALSTRTGGSVRFSAPPIFRGNHRDGNAFFSRVRPSLLVVQNQLTGFQSTRHDNTNMELTIDL